jgi:hypothetical protein
MAVIFWKAVNAEVDRGVAALLVVVKKSLMPFFRIFVPR